MRLVGKKYRYVVLTAPWFAAIAGFMSGLQPAGVEWRWFSFHPLLMTMGFVGMMANGIMVKKTGWLCKYKNSCKAFARRNVHGTGRSLRHLHE
mmetsp:Transcript_15109/g.19752  ORF Transcript_15109/g.19752 Transcript_15109/m.19752 type:complete len:93 (+) Transcript_15109:105-383(+)